MSYELILFLTLTVGLAQPVLAAEEHEEGPLYLHRLAAHPSDPDVWYAITGNMGVLRSRDGGRRWAPVNRGLRSFTHHGLAVAPAPGTAEPIVLVGGWGGGVSRSVDGGSSWTEINGDLGNTAVDAMVVDPDHSDHLYVATSTGVYRSRDGGAHWTGDGDGLPPFSEAVGYKTLVIEPSPTRRLWLGTEAGLFRRELDGGRWTPDPVLGAARVSALVYDAAGRRLYAGTVKQGVHVRSGESWRFLGGKSWFVGGVAVHPADPRVIYLATRGDGVLKSIDAGAHWAPANAGLGTPDVRSLAIHPADPSRLVAGTSSRGLWYSTDGGDRWRAAEPLPPLTMGGILAMLPPAAPAAAVPPAFAKCNQCHGWSDPPLNGKRTYWRVPANPRAWEATVARMAERAGLTSNERRTIAAFLTAYSRRNAR